MTHPTSKPHHGGRMRAARTTIAMWLPLAACVAEIEYDATDELRNELREPPQDDEGEDPCSDVDYCDCASIPGCEPVVDLSTGCLCEFENPFNCTGDEGDCVCGGATYLGCESKPPPSHCTGLDYCECGTTEGCEPAVDLSTGCLCEFEAPFDCSGKPGDCVCGGATYLGCAPS